jgi:hypothetical protein
MLTCLPRIKSTFVPLPPLEWKSEYSHEMICNRPDSDDYREGNREKVCRNLGKMPSARHRGKILTFSFFASSLKGRRHSFFHVPGADELKRSEDISFWVLAGRMRMFPAGRGTPQKEILIILAQARDNEEKRQRL